MENRRQWEGAGKREDGLNKKEKGLMDMNSEVIAGGEGSIRGLNGNGKNVVKIKLKNNMTLLPISWFKQFLYGN